MHEIDTVKRHLHVRFSVLSMSKKLIVLGSKARAKGTIRQTKYKAFWLGEVR